MNPNIIPMLLFFFLLNIIQIDVLNNIFELLTLILKRPFPPGWIKPHQKQLFLQLIISKDIYKQWRILRKFINSWSSSSLDWHQWIIDSWPSKVGHLNLDWLDFNDIGVEGLIINGQLLMGFHHLDRWHLSYVWRQKL